MTIDRPWRWLAIVPPLFLLGGVPYANRVRPLVGGLPFLLFWIVAGVIGVSATMGLILILDRRYDRAHALDAGNRDAPGTGAGAR